jgi:hypothetical protein
MITSLYLNDDDILGTLHVPLVLFRCFFGLVLLLLLFLRLGKVAFEQLNVLDQFVGKSKRLNDLIVLGHCQSLLAVQLLATFLLGFVSLKLTLINTQFVKLEFEEN